MARDQVDLSSTKAAFLRSFYGTDHSGKIVEAFHRWMQSQARVLSQLQPLDIEIFLALPRRRPITSKTKAIYERALTRYLTWARDQGYISKAWDAFLVVRPVCFRSRERGRSCVPLPEPARSFHRSLEPTLRPWTCHGYKSNLRQFHRWLDKNQITLRSLRRSHMEAWLHALRECGLSASTRLTAIMNIRVYLRWLRERGLIHRHPDDLVRRADLPKLPAYLPRPLPPKTDIELEDRLTSSACRYKKGLALMRFTGLRVGELCSLEYDCVRVDHNGNRFLKVPLGKMNNERLVPLDEATHGLIEELRSMEPRPRRSLLATEDGRRVAYESLRTTLLQACEGLDTAGTMTTHRLRHTYATSLLNGGISLVALMRLLGHRDFRMTLRYAAITDATISDEYSRALQQVEVKYQTIPDRHSGDPDAVKLLSDVARWMKTNLMADPSLRPSARALSKRLDRIRSELRELAPRPGTKPRAK